MARLGDIFTISSGGTPGKNESSYYVKPLGKSEVKEGWVNKKDVKLLREMIGR